MQWALASKRGQERRLVPGTRIIELGIHPYESVTVAKFREPLPAEFLQALGSIAKSKRSIEGLDVFELEKSRFALTLGKDMLVTINTLSTNEAMLYDVARRIASRHGDRLFESATAIWPAVDLESSFWGMRKTGTGPDAKYGDWVLFSYDHSRPAIATFRTVFNDSAVPRELASWIGMKAGDSTRNDLGAKIRVELKADGLETVIECLPDLRIAASACFSFTRLSA